MTAPMERSKFALTGGTTALLLIVCYSSAFASNGFKTHCSEATDQPPTPELPAPSLNVQIVDHGLIEFAADMKAPATEPGAEKITSPALAEVATSTADSETNKQDKISAVSDSDPLGTALRLLGVSEEDQPRFRRQMYRTDI